MPSSVTVRNLLKLIFVFQPSFGHDSIGGFIATGSTHDTINVDHTVFADWAHLLAASA
ncbi:hypothetical protein [Labrys wisconsinensis]|uniref:Uncharacterized protein n=1 Tax=Labrys wisconsinensis TaxID=425677 RepID=A0ABU0J4I9_9HYPH|nr:hypothetical protein [Labrys wisconsinensis]MDQ0468540.1 hypothetical protein [Labrys wisconsinensis]